MICFVLDNYNCVQNCKSFAGTLSLYACLPPTNKEVYAIAHDVCLSVCLLARLLKNACMDLNEILRVDRCPDMDELINF